MLLRTSLGGKFSNSEAVRRKGGICPKTVSPISNIVPAFSESFVTFAGSISKQADLKGLISTVAKVTGFLWLQLAFSSINV